MECNNQCFFCVFFSIDFSPRRSTTTWPLRSPSSMMEVTSLKCGFVVCSVLVWTRCVLFLSLFISDLFLCAKDFCFRILWVSSVSYVLLLIALRLSVVTWVKGFLQHFLQYLLEEDYLLLMNIFFCVHLIFLVDSVF